MFGRRRLILAVLLRVRLVVFELAMLVLIMVVGIRKVVMRR